MSKNHLYLAIGITSKLIFTKILNPIPKPKHKTSHNFRLHEDLAHPSFPSLRISPYLMETNPWDAFRSLESVESYKH